MQAFTLEQCVHLACMLEVTAPKPGNVHRGADFDDLCFADFLTSAVVTAPILAKTHEIGIGNAALESIERTQAAVGTNTNLGIVLLLAPLCSVPEDERLSDGIVAVLEGLTPIDSQQVYRAIGSANPGGMGEVDEHDVAGVAPDNLLEAMRLAADRDMIACQYSNGFADVFNFRDRFLVAALNQGCGLIDAIVWTHVSILAEHPDSLIARRRGHEEAAQASKIANAACRAVADPFEMTAEYFRLVDDLDFWLRSHKARNPGTTADLVTATLFCALRDRLVEPPFKW